MKVFIFLILFAFSSATILGQTWTQVPTGTDHTINDIFFVNKNIGWFVTHYGLVKKSTDGGLTWFKLDSLSYGAKRIQFLDMNNGYILSGNSYVYKTTNGGISWTPINTNFSVSLEGMDFISTQVGWVVGSSGKILKTTDGGQNWVNQSSITNEIFFDVDFLDANIGSVVGTGGKIYRSYLGGQDWFLQTSGTINTFSSVFLCNASYAWLTGYEIRKTSNGGSTWPTVAWISSFTTNSFFLNKDTGWVVTQDGQIGKTTNGQDFSGVSLIPSQNYNTVFFVDVNNGWVGGSFGVLLKYVIPQNIRLTSPDGGENWPAGSIRNITWDQTEIRNVKLEYSTNNGSDWIQIVASTPAYSGSYSWAIPNTVSSSCKVRATDINNSATSDESNSAFVISAAPDQSVTITSPTGGENWIAGNQYNITWTSFGVTNLKIEFTTNNGTDWSTIAETVPASNGAYMWIVPYKLSASCKVRLTCTNNPSVTDQSSLNFIISPQPGPLHLHEDFDHTFFPPQGWYYDTLGDTTFGQYWERSALSAFDSGSGSAGYYFYQAHAGKLQALTTYLMMNSSGTGILSFDHAYATRTNENDQLRIEYSTDEGTTWTGLRLLNGGISGELVTAPPTTVSFNPTSTQWASKSYSLPAGVNKVRFATISANGNNLYIDNIRISDSSTSKFVVITSPNGGESWTVGSTHNITWTQTGVTNVKLEYTTDSGTSWNQIAATTPGTTGSYFWTIPNTASTRCKVRITDVTDILISDQSDTTFTISELFQEVTIPNVPAVTHGALAWADYNNDGYLDFLVSGQGNQGNINKIFKNNGNGTFSEQSSFVLPRTASASIDWGDFNNDGYLDFIISGFNTDNSDWFTKVYMNDAGVQFIDATQNQLQKCHNGAVRWGDCDNDGDLDILVTGGGSAGEYFAKIYINDGVGGFHDLNLSGMTGVNSSSANWGDYDRDGDLDIIISGYSLDGIISKIYKNEGNNNFLFQSQISLSGVWQGTANWEDFNNDGFLDIIITGKITEGSAVTKIYKNNGDNSFSALASDPGVGLFLSSVQSGDFDNDGHTDLIQSGIDNSEVARTYFLGNNGNLTFTDRSAPLPGLYAGSVAGADFNNDFSLDVLICGENGSVSSTKLFKNITPITNSAPVEPSNLNAAVGNGIVNFSWTPGTDDHTPQGGLSYNIVIGTQPGKYDVVSPSADRTTGFRRISSRGKIQSNSWFIRGLQPGTYYWSVQTIDGSFKGSAFATETSFIVPQQTTGNYSLIFDGVDDYVGDMIEDKISGTSEFTVEAWVKLENFNFAGVITRGSHSGGNWSYNFRLDNAQLYWGVYIQEPPNYVTFSPALNDWHHIAGVRTSDGYISLFIDGIKVGSTPCPTTNLFISTPLNFGTYFNDQFGFFKGKLTRIRISKSARYLSNFAPPISYQLDQYTVGQWDFEEGTGSALSDKSTNQINGIIHGATWSTDFPIAQNSLSIVSPNGGENWAVGTTEEITWTQNGVQNVKLEYTTDNGSTWSQIVSSTPGSPGSYTWTIPNVNSFNCKIRISDVTNQVIPDQSDSVFNIYQLSSGNFSLQFDGINDYVGEMFENQIAGTNAFTLECWVKLAAGEFYPIINRGTSTDWSYNLYNADKLYFGTIQGGYIFSNPLDTNTWHHVAASWDTSGMMRLFVNGQLIAESPRGSGAFGANKELNFGKYFVDAAASFMKGKLTRIRVSKIARYSTNFDPPINYTVDQHTIGQWDFGEGSGAILYDRSGNHLHGSIKGASWSTDFPNLLSAITLTSPNGGENWLVGSSHNITWTYTNVSNVKIEYTTNNGTNWIQISSSTLASAGSFSWTIPNTVSTDCRIKITDISDSLVTDQSNNTFTISAAPSQSVTVTSPNGGENWQVGSSHNITWTQTNVSNVKIEYSTNNGTSWIQVVASISASTGSFSWTIPNTASTNCRVKVTDVSNSSINDQSNSTFIISAVPSQSVTLTSPNGGENWTVGTSQNITWTQTNLSNLKIDYTTDNGANWNQIVSSVSANSGSYSWTVPNTPSTTCKVRLTDVSNNQLSDQSNGTFTILPQSTGNYSLYFDGVNDYVGNIFENKVLGASPFTLELWVKNQSSNVAPLISRGSNSGVDWSYNLYVHDSLYFGVNFPLKYVGAGSPSLNSWHHVAAVKSSDGFLKLYIDGTKVSESYYGTGNLTSNFSLQFGKYFADGSSDYFKGYITRIRISKTARYIEDFNPTLTFVLDTNTAGLWNFSENSGTLLTDVSGNSFHGTIHGATWSSDFPQISGNITVTSPNGGENWTVGSAHYISWVQNGVSNVKIEYTTNQGITWQQIISSTSASTGNYLWTIPNTISTTCKVRITDDANGLVKDQSNAVFSISPAPNLTLTAPNGGENWPVGSSQNITWTQSGITNLKIEYSTNDGSSWTQIVASTPASAGSYQWTIPNTVSSSCRVRISDAATSSVSDQSNAVFTISAAPVFSVMVTSPNGGERWFAGNQYSIAWNSVNVENLKLEYTSDGGSSWTQIAGSVAANLGSYIWTIPNTPSSNCKVRLTSVANPGITDESDAAFTIAEAPKVTLTSPNGGETWLVGRQYSITWTAVSVNKLKGEYSTDGGTMWILIADTISANLGSYIWTMPNTESGNCLVRLSGIDQTSAGDQSDAPFTIELERSLTITAPVPGETYTSGRILEIKWSKLNVDLVDLLYSTDDGVYWQYIADSISSASQSYNWLIPELNSNQVRIRAVASQKQDLRSDLNGNITILPSPKISLVSNLSAAYLKTGSNYHIEWLLENVPAVNVLFSSDGGSVWNQIAGNLMPSVRSFNWVVPDLNSKNCRVKIEATNNSSLFSSNELTFTIYSYSQVVTVSNVWQFGDIRDVGNYRLISLPGSVTGDLGSIMSGKFTTDWNAYWDNGSDVDYQIQYNGGPQFNLQPGKGFWVLSKDPISLSKQTEAVTIDSTLLYHVPLHKGWNIIGNVFTKSINWSDIRFVNGLPQSSLLYYWDGKWDFPSVMEPYKGYYFFNPDNRSSLKIIYPVEASLAKTGEENPVSGKENGIVLSFGGNEILATFDPVSSTGLDTNDYFLPGVNFCRKRIAFTREDNGITRQLFIDSQPLDSLGNKFRFSILNETSTPDDLKLNLKIEQKNLNIYLLDEKYSEFIDLRVKNSFKLSPQKGSRYYTLMIGDDSFIRTMKSQYLPTEYLLYQNFPNPFNPETSIKYALPADGYIKLKMYDILGNEVLTLFEGEESAGVHTRAFNLSGFASGVYFYRLETSGTNLLKKMILMK